MLVYQRVNLHFPMVFLWIFLFYIFFFVCSREGKLMGGYRSILTHHQSWWRAAKCWESWIGRTLRHIYIYIENSTFYIDMYTVHCTYTYTVYIYYQIHVRILYDMVIILGIYHRKSIHIHIYIYIYYCVEYSIWYTRL